MQHPTHALLPLTIGLDLGDKHSHACGVSSAGEIAVRTRVPTTRASLIRQFGPRGKITGGKRCRIVMEASTHSPWVSRLLTELGHEVVVANPRTMMQRGGRRRRKNDRIDAEGLARIGRMDVQLLAPIQHRGPEARADLSLIRARDAAVASRTSLINTVRGLVKTHGGRIRTCSAPAFHKRAPEQIPSDLEPALLPLTQMIEQLSDVIRAYDRQIDKLSRDKYPEAQRLTQVTGVGNLTALTYVLTLEDPRRFARSRSVGAFLGLVANQHQSGDVDPELRITKAGDVMLRRLMVTAAHYILGPMNRVDSDLRRFGQRLAQRGGKTSRKKAIVAVARKLAVLLHALWRTGADYEPLRHAEPLRAAS